MILFILPPKRKQWTPFCLPTFPSRVEIKKREVIRCDCWWRRQIRISVKTLVFYFKMRLWIRNHILNFSISNFRVFSSPTKWFSLLSPLLKVELRDSNHYVGLVPRNSGDSESKEYVFCFVTLIGCGFHQFGLNVKLYVYGHPAFDLSLYFTKKYFWIVSVAELGLL